MKEKRFELLKREKIDKFHSQSKYHRENTFITVENIFEDTKPLDVLLFNIISMEVKHAAR